MKTSRTSIVLSIAVLSLAALPLSACSKRADASTQSTPSETNEPKPAPPPGDAPSATDRPDDSPRARDGRGKRHGGKRGRGDRAGGQKLQRLREILKSAGVSREQMKVVFERLRTERERGGPVRADQVLGDVASKLSQEQRDEATKILRESTDAPADD